MKLYSIESSRDDLKWLVTIFAAVNVFAMIGTILCNMIALVTLIKQRTLHTASNALLTAICLADVFSAVLVQTVYERMLECILTGSPPGCINKKIVTAFHMNFATCKGSICIITAMISIDRYMAICFPFKYLSWVTIRKYTLVVLLLTGLWTAYILCLTLIIPMRMFYGSIAVIVLFGAVTINVTYTRILFIVHHQRVRVQTLGEIDGAVTSPPQAREKSKALVILVEILIFNIFNIPILVFATYYSRNGLANSFREPFILMNFGFMLSNITCFLNPFVYCFRSSEIRRAIKKLVPQRKSNVKGFKERKLVKVVPIDIERNDATNTRE